MPFSINATRISTNSLVFATMRNLYSHALRSTVVNDLGGSLTVDGIMNFILDFFEELDGDFCFWVVVNAGCIDFQNQDTFTLLAKS